MFEQRGTIVAALVMTLAAATGCSGGKSSGSANHSGASLQQQHVRATADTNPQSRADALTRIGYQQHRAGDNSGADTSLHEASKAAAEIEDPYRRATAEALLASAYARCSNKSEAAKTLKKAAAMVEKIPSTENKIDALSRIAAAYGADLQEPGNAMAKLQEAEKLADSVTDINDRLIGIAAIIRGYQKANKTADVNRLIGKAGELSEGIDDARQKAEALITFGRALVDANRKDEAISQLQAAATAASQITRLDGKVHAMTMVAEQYAYVGDLQKARTLLAEADAVAKSIPQVDLRKIAQDRVRQLSTSLTSSKSN